MFWGLLAPFLLALGSIHRYRQLRRGGISENGEPVLKNQYSIPSQTSIDSPTHPPRKNSD